jgi:phytoene synthase
MPNPFAELPSADLEACKALLRKGSKSFSLASLLLPRRVRDPAAAVYAFCRVADDLVDEHQGGDQALQALHRRLDRAYDGNPDPDPVDRAFSAVVRAYDIPKDVPEALLEGFAWDAQGRTYASLDDLQAYAARVAGTVGVMMTLLMGPRDEATLQRACDLGVAMQLTNVARDVGEDARNGRVYLPLAWLEEAGVQPASFLKDPAFRPEIAAVVRRLLERADALYESSELGIALLPQDCRAAIRSARLIYAEIGHELGHQGFDSVSRRTVVSTSKKLWLVLRALVGRTPGERLRALPAAPYEPLEQTAFLVNASVRPRGLLQEHAS